MQSSNPRKIWGLCPCQFIGSVDDAVKAVAGIAQAWHDVGVLVQFLIDCADHHLEVDGGVHLLLEAV